MRVRQRGVGLGGVGVGCAGDFAEAWGGGALGQRVRRCGGASGGRAALRVLVFTPVYSRTRGGAGQVRRAEADAYRRDREAESRENERAGRPGDVDFQRLINVYRGEHVSERMDVSRERRTRTRVGCG